MVGGCFRLRKVAIHMSNLVPPHGGELVSRLVPEAEKAERLAEAKKLDFNRVIRL